MALINYKITIEKVVVESDPEVKNILLEILKAVSEDPEEKKEIMRKLDKVINDIKNTV